MKKIIISSMLIVSVMLISLLFILNPFKTGLLKASEDSKVNKEETKASQEYKQISFSVIGID